MKIILASKSPRRKELFSLLGLDFIQTSFDIDESIASFSSAEDYVIQIVTKKAEHAKNIHPDALVLCADTIVSLDGEILEKPTSQADAYRIIKSLSGKSHSVLTAVSITHKEDMTIFVEETLVNVAEMTEEEINDYINSDEPYDKAGAYGIQGLFSKYISSIKGDYYNVVGLPLARLYQELKNYL